MNIKVDKKEILKKQDQEFLEAIKNDDYKALVKKVKISEEDAKNNTMKLLDSVEELNNCKNCHNLFRCANKYKGYVFFPEIIEGNLRFTYIPCKYEKQAKRQEMNKKTKDSILENARIKDIKITKNRSELIKWIKEYYDNYNPYQTSKGLYLHGNFGTGKTFIVASLFNELKNKFGITTEIIYVPELLRNLKENFDEIGDKINYLENVDLLLLDDIGAEKVTEWGRDEIIGTILQTRMNNAMPTFFTSNLNITELEKVMSITNNSIDVIKAKRIIERVSYLTDDIELLGNNYRDDENKENLK